jgi:hypothetical protein
LDRELREGIGPALAECGIERAQLAIENAHRPTVGDDVVQGEEQHVFAVREPDQPPARERTGFKIERGLAFLDRQALQRVLGVALAVEVMLLERKPDVCRGETLNGATVHGEEGGSQRLVPSDEAVERPAQGAPVQFAAEPNVQRDVVALAGAVHLRHEPQPLLLERQRQRAGAVRRFDRGRRAPLALPRGGGKIGQRRPGKEIRQRHVDAQGVPQP